MKTIPDIAAEVRRLVASSLSDATLVEDLQREIIDPMVLTSAVDRLRHALAAMAHAYDHDCRPPDDALAVAREAAAAMRAAVTRQRMRPVADHTPGPWRIHSGRLIRAEPPGSDVAVPIADMRTPFRAVHERPLACTFCGRTKDQVKVLVAGPTVCICDGCVGIAAEIVAELAAKQPEAPTP